MAALRKHCILITDAVGVGLDYFGQHVAARDGAAYLDDGTLTGSTISMADAVRNMQTLVGLPRAVDMATTTPARALGIDSYAARGIGGRADLSRWIAVHPRGRRRVARRGTRVRSALMPTVALFVTCVVDQIAPEVGMGAVRLLEAAGVTVAFPGGANVLRPAGLQRG